MILDGNEVTVKETPTLGSDDMEVEDERKSSRNVLGVKLSGSAAQLAACLTKMGLDLKEERCRTFERLLSEVKRHECIMEHPPFTEILKRSKLHFSHFACITTSCHC